MYDYLNIINTQDNMKNDKLIPDSPSPLEEEFQYEFTELIDQYKKDFLTHGWSAEELAKWCKEMVDKELRESEDERLRKHIVKFIDEQYPTHGNLKEEKDKMLAYLEKREEQKPVDYEAELKKCKDNPLYFYDKYVSIKQKPAECIEFDNEFKNQVSHLLVSVLNKEWEYDKEFVEYAAQQLLGYAKHEIQPAEWSEEDEKMRNLAIEWAEIMSAQFSFVDMDSTDFCKIISWLKSLRPQYHGDVTMTEAYEMGLEAGKASSWKPSEEQMEALLLAIEGKCPPTSYMSRRLEDLYDGLANTFGIDEPNEPEYYQHFDPDC